MMERLSNRRFHLEECFRCYCDDCFFCDSLISALKKLADYEDAEEQGRLLRLPCKVDKEVKEQILKLCSDNGIFK